MRKAWLSGISALIAFNVMFPEMSEIGFNCNICRWIFQILGIRHHLTLDVHGLGTECQFKPLSVPIKLNSIKTCGISLTNPISLMITEFTSSAISINDLPRRPCNSPLLQASQLVKSLLRRSQSCRTRPRCRPTPPTS